MKKMVPKYAASVSNDNLGTLFILPNNLKFIESEKYIKTGEEAVYELEYFIISILMQNSIYHNPIYIGLKKPCWIVISHHKVLILIQAGGSPMFT